MQFDRTHTYNLEGAIHGMRNPMNSWDRSDSSFGLVSIYNDDYLTDVAHAWVEAKEDVVPDSSAYYDLLGHYENWLTNQGILDECGIDDIYTVAFIGPKDMELAQKLILAGEEHAKFLRQIFVSVDITAPLYWWKEADTYKVGTVANSTSTMHKLSSTPLTQDLFDFDGLDIIVDSYTIPHGGDCETIFEDYVDDIIDMCENLRLKFNKTGDKSYWRALIQILPSAYLQTRTITMSYANLRNIYFQRKNHKLKEWHQFCDWLQTLPYAKELIIIGEHK